MSDPKIKADVQQMLDFQAEVARRASEPSDTLRVDRFGIPELFPLAESDSERSARVAAVENLVKEVAEVATLHLGREEARKLFAEALRADREGKQPTHEEEILECYDRLLAKLGASRKLIRAVAVELRRCDLIRNFIPTDYTGTIDATMTRIRRVVRNRNARYKSARRQYEEFEKAYEAMTGRRLDPPLLESAAHTEVDPDL